MDRRMLRFVERMRACLMAAAMVLMASCGAGDGDAGKIRNYSPYEVAKHLGLGWNLGNQLDAFHRGVADENAWGNQPVGQKFFYRLAEAGFTSVRIPVTWMGHFWESPDYSINPRYMDRVAEVVDYAEKAGLNVILNIHHDGADSNYWLDIKNAAQAEAVNEKVKSILAALWTQIANRFKDKGDFLIFEAMNEIHDGKWGWGGNKNDGNRQYTVLNEWNQVFVDAVRATGGNNACRYLGVPGYVTNIDLTVEHFKLPSDKVPGRLMVAVHYYAPIAYTLDKKYSEWGHAAKDSLKYPGEDEDYMQEQFRMMRKAFIDRGIPAYIGEMGCVSRQDERSEHFRRYFLEYLCKAAKDNGMAPFYWDNGQDGSSLFDRTTGAFRPGAEKAIEVMRRAVFSENPSYTLQWVYEHCAPHE